MGVGFNWHQGPNNVQNRSQFCLSVPNSNQIHLVLVLLTRKWWRHTHTTINCHIHDHPFQFRTIMIYHFCIVSKYHCNVWPFHCHHPLFFPGSHKISIFNILYCHPPCDYLTSNQSERTALSWFERIFTELTNIGETLERWIKLTNIVERVPLFVPLVHQKGGQRKLISHIPHIPDLQ